MRSSPILLLRNPPSMMHADFSQPHLARTLPSWWSNALKPTESMVGGSKRHMLPKCEQSPVVSVDPIAPLAEQTLLERMGLRNQMLMMRLGLPLKTSQGQGEETSLPSDLGEKAHHTQMDQQ